MVALFADFAEILAVVPGRRSLRRKGSNAARAGEESARPASELAWGILLDKLNLESRFPLATDAEQ